MKDEVKYFKETKAQMITLILMKVLIFSFLFFYFLEINDLFHYPIHLIIRVLILLAVVVVFVVSLIVTLKWRIILTQDSITKKGIFFESSILFVDVINIEISKHFGYRLITNRINFTLGGENHIENREELIEGIETRLKKIGVDVENIKLRPSTPWLFR